MRVKWLSLRNAACDSSGQIILSSQTDDSCMSWSCSSAEVALMETDGTLLLKLFSSVCLRNPSFFSFFKEKDNSL